MNTTKQRINIVGTLAGLFLAAIPFYYYIRVFSSLKIIKKIESLYKFILIAVITSFVAPVLCIIIYSIALASVMRSSLYYYGYAAGALWIAFLFIILILLATLALFIITGFKTKAFLDSDKSSFLTEDERFEMAKVAGVHLAYIPFYSIYLSVKNMEMIKSIDEIMNGLLIAFFVLYGANILLSAVPFLSYFLSLGLMGVMIFIGVKINEYYTYAKENNDNFTSHESDGFNSF